MIKAGDLVRRAGTDQARRVARVEGQKIWLHFFDGTGELGPYEADDFEIVKEKQG